MKDKKIEFLVSKIRLVPDFPKKGIVFYDITTLIKDHKAFSLTCKILKDKLKNLDFDTVVAIESRGFIFGAILAYLMKKSFVLIRKAGKLPAKTIQEEYDLEYGRAKIEIHEDAISKGDKVLLFDDLLATGGTMLAACKLIEKLGGRVKACAVIIELSDLEGKKKLQKYSIRQLIKLKGK